MGEWGIGTDIGDLYRDYHRDPFPHSLLRTRQVMVLRVFGDAEAVGGLVFHLLGSWEGMGEWTPMTLRGPYRIPNSPFPHSLLRTSQSWLGAEGLCGGACKAV